MPEVDRSQQPQRQQSVAASVHSILVRNTDAYMQKYGSQVCPHVESTLLRMHYCRTTAMGKRVYRCDPCNYETTVFNSCGDRNCPQCTGAKRSNWLDNTMQLTTPKATYFQVVFTLTNKLSPLVLGNRTVLYDLLFETAWASLRAKIEKELGIQAAGVAVLHTWNQRLGHHPHVHMMVPGSGPSLDGTRWVDCRMEWCNKTKKMKPFLVCNKELGRDFRDLFLNRLTELIKQGKINLEDAKVLTDLIGELRLQNWVAFIEGPPKPECPPSQMLKYLTRYLTGGPISNGRIVGEKNGRVYFKARSKNKGEGQVVTSLPIVEFVQQWSLHILPKEYTKTRHFGAWSGSKKRRYLEQSLALAPKKTDSKTESTSNSSASTDALKATAAADPKKKNQRTCPHCQASMTCVIKEDRPSWRDLFYGPDHPPWLEWTSRGLNSPPDAPLDLPEEELQELEPIESLPDIFDEMIALRCK
jgi:Putative transposase/Transposase zinc-binding domain